MNITKPIHNKLFEGDSIEATATFPFLDQGAFLKVVDTSTRKIGVFPSENSFYVVTYYPLAHSKYHAIIEKTNNLSKLDEIVRRETCNEQFLSENIILQVKDFLKEHKCMNILV